MTTPKPIIKRCVCGQSYTAAQWQKLLLLGTNEQGEWRNCRCGSTLLMKDGKDENMTNLQVVADPQPCRMSDLVRNFPTLRHAEGLCPFNAITFHEWAQRDLSHGGVYAARFVLAVWHGHMGKVSDKPRKTPDKDNWHGTHRWNLDSHWRIGPFDVVDAMSTWDVAHREAFVTWARNPWFP